MKRMAKLREAKRLHALGFGILWLHPRSKRPIGNEWTSGPRKKWPELKESFGDEFNMGVRLGDASKIGDHYLAVIDVDVKSTDEKHRKEAMRALKELVGSAKFPEVRSGRGNGSRHLYCLTEVPFKTWNPAMSLEMVKVKMPSKSPSKREIEELSGKEIKAGIRLSRAWEISYYSQGRQVVLPPSIHPDSGKEYTWVEHLAGADSLPVLNLSRSESEDEKLAKRGAQETVEDFEIDEALDVRWLPMDEATRALIVSGLWKGSKIEDRSAYLLPAASGLQSAGLDKNGILTVLTDRSTYLGECAFDHAKTDSRARAAKWLWNYTVKKVLADKNPATAFSHEAIVEDYLDESEVEKQSAEIEGETHWTSKLDRTKEGGVRATYNNCKLFLVNEAEDEGFVGRDEFAVQDYYLKNVPWESKCGDPITDIDVVRIKDFLAGKYGVEFGDNTINQCLLKIADTNRYHPVRDYLSTLEWDGEARIETWLKDYAGARGPDAYLRAVSRKVLVAMIRRVMEPGCKFDHVLILEGLQGTGKSTLLARLADKWFTDQPINLGDKDAILTMQSKWLLELGELSSLNRSEVEAMKAFISQRTDRIRAPYGRRVEDYPRQMIFVGSTNLDEYLKDETGNRRFWPVRCTGKLDFDGVGRDRDQLFAEALEYYKMGEPLYLETDELNALAGGEQAQRAEVDEWFGAVADVVNGEMFPRGGFEMRQLADKLVQFNAARLERNDQMRLAKILRQLGFEKFQEGGGDRRKLWRGSRTTSNHLEPPRTPKGGSSKNSQIPDFF